MRGWSWDRIWGRGIVMAIGGGSHGDGLPWVMVLEYGEGV